MTVSNNIAVHKLDNCCVVTLILSFSADYKMYNNILCHLPSVPEVTLERMIYEVYEDDTTVSLCVELKSDLKRDLEVHLYLQGVTATGKRVFCCDASVRMIVSCQTAGTDFDGTSPLTQTFVSGSTVGDRVYFDIPIFDDDIVEKEEFFSALLNADAKIHIDTAYVQITDNDSKQE